MHCYAPSKVQQNIQKFENGNVHNAKHQKAQKDELNNDGQVFKRVIKYEVDAFINKHADELLYQSNCVALIAVIRS